jgi:hypothetical protein
MWMQERAKSVRHVAPSVRHVAIEARSAWTAGHATCLTYKLTTSPRRLRTICSQDRAEVW